MSRSSVIAGLMLFAFVVFSTMRGTFPGYLHAVGLN